MADEGGVRRATSAYVYFQREFMKDFKGKSDIPLSAADFGSRTAEAWRALDQNQRVKYRNLAAVDRERFERECDAADERAIAKQEERRASNVAKDISGPRISRAIPEERQKIKMVIKPKEMTIEQQEKAAARKSLVSSEKANREKLAEEVEKQRAAVKNTHQQQAQKRLRYLLGQSDIFKTHFGLGKEIENHEQKDTFDSRSKNGLKRGNTFENEEFSDADESSEAPTFLTHQPPSVKGKMRSYQLEGLNWMINLQAQGINGILADEMGLGKTLQAIAILAYNLDFLGLRGPHIVILPKSTLGNWRAEFANFCPALNVVSLFGDMASREAIIRERLRPGVPQNERDWDVCLTTYEVARMEVRSLSKIGWRYLIIDEAHKLKNEKSQVNVTARSLQADHRLLLTGTPLQNNLHELWALLNILLPDIFSDSNQFNEFFNLETGDSDSKKTVIAQLHKILRPFMLRRLKSEAAKELPPKTETILYTKMSKMQRQLYKDLLMRNVGVINSTGSGVQKTALLNILMQLRKCCNHPYLFPAVEDRTLDPLGEHLVDACGKLKLLDKLLKRLKEQNHRVLIFSQMTTMLDILEDTMRMRGYDYCRIDGNTSYDERDDLIDSFNAPDSIKFCFLLSTRAGGLGINLQTADTVILFDSDWNPQADLQAQDRAHRIGQKRPVRVFRLVTENTVEEKVVERAEQKLKLDAMVVQQGRLAQKVNIGKEEMLEALRFGADNVFRSEGEEVTDEDIDAILARGEAKTAELNQKLSRMEKGDMFDFKLDGGLGVQTFEGTDFSNRANRSSNGSWTGIDMGKRLRKPVEPILTTLHPVIAPPVKKKVPKLPPALTLPTMQSWQFFNRDRLHELQMLASNRYAALRDTGADIPEDASQLLQLIFSPEELEERNEILSKGFHNWENRDMVQTYVDAAAEFGRHAYQKISQAIGKSEEEVELYTKAFWEYGPTQMPSTLWDRWGAKIERAEKRAIEIVRMERAAALFVARYQNPWKQIEFKLSNQQGKQFTIEEDRHMLCYAVLHGYGAWREVRDSLLRNSSLALDYHLRSLNVDAVGKRCEVLLKYCEKELQDSEARRRVEEVRRIGKITMKQEAARLDVADKASKVSDAEALSKNISARADEMNKKKILLEKIVQGMKTGVIEGVMLPYERPDSSEVASGTEDSVKGSSTRKFEKMSGPLKAELANIIENMGNELKTTVEINAAFRNLHPEFSQNFITKCVKTLGVFETRELSQGQSRRRWFVRPQYQCYLNGQSKPEKANGASKSAAKLKHGSLHELSQVNSNVNKKSKSNESQEQFPKSGKKTTSSTKQTGSKKRKMETATEAETPEIKRSKNANLLTGFVLFSKKYRKTAEDLLPGTASNEDVDNKLTSLWNELSPEEREELNCEAQKEMAEEESNQSSDNSGALEKQPEGINSKNSKSLMDSFEVIDLATSSSDNVDTD